MISQVLNAYGKVFPTQPPSGRPVREAARQGPSWERHVDEHDPENPPDKLERKKNIGDPAWCHSDSRRKLQLEQVQLEALAGSSNHMHEGVTVQPATSDYDRRKQERLQAIRSVPRLSWLVVSASPLHTGALAEAASRWVAGCCSINIPVPMPHKTTLHPFSFKISVSV